MRGALIGQVLLCVVLSSGAAEARPRVKVGPFVVGSEHLSYFGPELTRSLSAHLQAAGIELSGSDVVMGRLDELPQERVRLVATVRGQPATAEGPLESLDLVMEDLATRVATALIEADSLRREGRQGGREGGRPGAGAGGPMLAGEPGALPVVEVPSVERAATERERGATPTTPESGGAGTAPAAARKDPDPAIAPAASGTSPDALKSTWSGSPGAPATAAGGSPSPASPGATAGAAAAETAPPVVASSPSSSPAVAAPALSPAPAAGGAGAALASAAPPSPNDSTQGQKDKRTGGSQILQPYGRPVYGFARGRVVAHAIPEGSAGLSGAGASATQAFFSHLRRRHGLQVIPLGYGMVPLAVAVDEGWRMGARAVAMARLIALDRRPVAAGYGGTAGAELVACRLEVALVRDGRLAFRRVVDAPYVEVPRGADAVFVGVSQALESLAADLGSILSDLR